MPTFGEFLLPIFTNGREFMNLEKHLLSLPAKVLVLDLIVVHVVVHVVRHVVLHMASHVGHVTEHRHELFNHCHSIRAFIAFFVGIGG